MSAYTSWGVMTRAVHATAGAGTEDLGFVSNGYISPGGSYSTDTEKINCVTASNAATWASGHGHLGARSCSGN